MKLVAKIFAVLAILGLVISSFAFVPFAGAQMTGGTQATVTALDRDLTVGASGPEVAAMQSMLISFGYPIPAGPTGYFGAQTRAALAAYQAALGITPAAGYFGPKTRAAFAATTPAPIGGSAPEDDREEEAREAFETAQKALERAEDIVEEADEDGYEVNDAEDELEEGRERLEESEDYLAAKEYGLAEAAAWDVEDSADRAVEAIEEREDRDEDEDDEVSTSARVSSTDGADNDVARFGIEFQLRAPEDSAYIDEDADVSVNYQIEDQDGDVISSATARSATLESSADQDDGYYELERGEGEDFELLVAFDPSPTDEGQFFRLRLLSVEYRDEPSASANEARIRFGSEYRTDSVYIRD